MVVSCAASAYGIEETRQKRQAHHTMALKAGQARASSCGMAAACLITFTCSVHQDGSAAARQVKSTHNHIMATAVTTTLLYHSYVYVAPSSKDLVS